MRLYWEVARRGFRRYATYRGATFAGVFTNTVFGLLRAYVYLAVIHARPVVGGFDRTDLLTYTFVGQGLIMVVYLWGWDEVARRIRSGDIALDLAKPYHFIGYWLATDLGRAVYHAAARGITPFLLASLIFNLRVPTSPVVWGAFFMSAAMAVCVSFAQRMLTNLSAFWFFDHRGVDRIGAACWTFLSGFIVPITFFPTGLARVARVLPFAAMMQTPIEIFLGKRHGSHLVLALAGSVVWSIVLLGCVSFVLTRATRRVVVQGG
jgi:ABC-2 type transport system permease protein